jgi:hypothetical protein
MLEIVLEKRGAGGLRPRLRPTQRKELAMPTKSIRPIRVQGKVAFIPLTKGYEAVIDAEDVRLVEGVNWWALIGKWNAVYAVCKTPCDANGKRKTVYMHRVVMDAPDGMEVDHYNGDGLDNRRSTNLRLATHSQNQHNQRIRNANTSGTKGVSWMEDVKKWRANIRVNGKQKHLGCFVDITDAAAAYAKASAELHGEFGRVK